MCGRNYLKLFCVILMSCCIFVVSLCAYSDEVVPPIVINKHACPFECCQFGKWTARSAAAVVLYKAPDAKALNRKIKKGETITALTGETHSKPVKAKVTHTWKGDEDHGLHVGDTV